jgi:phage terminase large subunit
MWWSGALSALVIETAEVFEPLLAPSRYKAAHGGRGSGKSHFFAGLLVDDHYRNPGMRSVCVREVQKSLKDSAKKLIENKIAEFGLGAAEGFECLEHETRTPGGGLIIYQGMQDHTAESIKSLEGFDRAWVEEAQTLSPTSLKLLRPTIRAPGSELWFSWNPRLKSDPVDKLFRDKERPTHAVVVEANWDANYWFPPELEEERTDCLRMDPDQYDHIWEGGYITISEGAYFAKQLTEAKRRIGHVAADPLMEYRAFWDIGTRDATAIWVAQFVGREIRVLDYYEAVGQPLAAHLGWLRDRGYGSALCVLPHDGEAADHLTAEKFADHIRSAGFRVLTVKNQGKGAALKRVEAARRLFPSIWFNEPTTQPGRDALGWYHEKRDDKRNIGLGPEHDWSSHGADAFGLMCIAYEEPLERRKANRPSHVGAGGWMG